MVCTILGSGNETITAIILGDFKLRNFLQSLCKRSSTLCASSTTNTMQKSLTRSILKYCHITKHFDSLIKHHIIFLLIIFLLQLISRTVIICELINYAIAPRNMMIMKNSYKTIFTFIDKARTTNNTININILLDTGILVVWIGIVIISFILIIVVIDKVSKQKKKAASRHTIPNGKKLQNNSKSNNVNGINYILDVVDLIAAGIKKYGVMDYKLEKFNIILLFEKESKLKFESRSKNENVECGDFSMELLLLIIIKHLIVMRNHQLSFVLRSTPFYFDEMYI